MLTCALLWSAAAPLRAQRVPTGAGEPLTQDQIRELIARVVANQHRNDAALMEYERRERHVARKNEDDAAVEEDKLYRVVPTGTGTLRLILEEKGKPVDAENYRWQLRELEKTLLWALNPEESRQKQRVQKWQKRSKERAETVDATRDAFLYSWLDRENWNGREVIKLKLTPNPDFKARSRTTDLFDNVEAVVWIDAAAAQLARVEAEVTRNISIGGGVFGKIYKGGRFLMQQSEVAEGIWLPTRMQYDFKGRKFVFPFELHEAVETAGYRRIGGPAMALAAIRRELNGTQPSGTGQ